MDRVKVQVVDDHFLFAQSMATIVREVPAIDLVGIAVTGQQAVSLAQERQPDVVLLDYHLPGYTADALIPRLRAAAGGVRIVVLTSDTSAAARERALASGADGFLTKDQALDDVVSALAAVAATALEERTARAVLDEERAGADGDEEDGAASQAEPHEPLELRLFGVSSFAEAAGVERSLAAAEAVLGSYIRDVGPEAASLRVALRPGAGQEQVLAALARGWRVEVRDRGPGMLDLALARAVATSLEDPAEPTAGARG